MKTARLTLLVTMLVGSAIPNGAHRLLRHDHHTSPLLLNPTVAFMQHITTSGYKAMRAALAKPGPGSAHALHGRRALGETLFNIAADAMNSLAAGAEVAAGEAGKQAGKEAKQLAATIIQDVTGHGVTPPPETPAPTYAPAPMPVSVPGPAFATAPAPCAALAPTPAVTPMGVPPTPSVSPSAATPAASPMQLDTKKAQLDQEREQAVPNFQLGAFLFEHATLIDPLEGGSYGHVVQAVKLAQQQLHVEATNWLMQQKDQASEEEPHADAMSKLVEELPGDIAHLPQDVAGTFAGFERHLGNEALNKTYYMDQWEKLRQKLQDPVAVQAGAQVFSNNVCFFSANFGAVEASATGVSVAPSLLSLSAAGINVAPQAISISPALISVGATGVNVSPTGLNIAPALIAVTPGRVAINPQGGTISPVGLSVTAPSTP